MSLPSFSEKENKAAAKDYAGFLYLNKLQQHLSNRLVVNFIATVSLDVQ